MIVRGFLQGLHASPYHGFSVQFSEHRRYTAGDDPKNIDWLAYAKTDRYYIKKYEAETNLTGLSGDGPEPVHGLHLPSTDDEVHLLHLFGGGLGVSHVDATRFGRAGHI